MQHAHQMRRPSPRVAAADVKMPHQAGPRPGDTSGDSPDLNIQRSPLTFTAKLPPADAHLAQSRFRGSAANADKVAVVPSDAEAHRVARAVQAAAKGLWVPGPMALGQAKGEKAIMSPPLWVTPCRTLRPLSHQRGAPKMGLAPKCRGLRRAHGGLTAAGRGLGLLLVPGASPQRRTRCTEYPRAPGLCLTPSGGPRLIGPTG